MDVHWNYLENSRCLRAGIFKVYSLLGYKASGYNFSPKFYTFFPLSLMWFWVPKS